MPPPQFDHCGAPFTSRQRFPVDSILPRPRVMVTYASSITSTPSSSLSSRTVNLPHPHSLSANHISNSNTANSNNSNNSTTSTITNTGSTSDNSNNNNNRHSGTVSSNHSRASLLPPPSSLTIQSQSSSPLITVTNNSSSNTSTAPSSPRNSRFLTIIEQLRIAHSPCNSAVSTAPTSPTIAPSRNSFYGVTDFHLDSKSDSPTPGTPLSSSRSSIAVTPTAFALADCRISHPISRTSFPPVSSSSHHPQQHHYQQQHQQQQHQLPHLPHPIPVKPTFDSSSSAANSELISAPASISTSPSINNQLQHQHQYLRHREFEYPMKTDSGSTVALPQISLEPSTAAPTGMSLPEPANNSIRNNSLGMTGESPALQQQSVSATDGSSSVGIKPDTPAASRVPSGLVTLPLPVPTRSNSPTRLQNLQTMQQQQQPLSTTGAAPLSIPKMLPIPVTSSNASTPLPAVSGKLFAPHVLYDASKPHLQQPPHANDTVRYATEQLLNKNASEWYRPHAPSVVHGNWDTPLPHAQLPSGLGITGGPFAAPGSFESYPHHGAPAAYHEPGKLPVFTPIPSQGLGLTHPMPGAMSGGPPTSASATSLSLMSDPILAAARESAPATPSGGAVVPATGPHSASAHRLSHGTAPYYVPSTAPHTRQFINSGSISIRSASSTAVATAAAAPAPWPRTHAPQPYPPVGYESRRTSPTLGTMALSGVATADGLSRENSCDESECTDDAHSDNSPSSDRASRQKQPMFQPHQQFPGGQQHHQAMAPHQQQQQQQLHPLDPAFTASAPAPQLNPIPLQSGATPARASNGAKKRRGNLPKFVVAILKKWLLEHVSHPYPSEDEKIDLANRTGLTLSQISNWFINARRRILQPMFDEIQTQQNVQATAATTAVPSIGQSPSVPGSTVSTVPATATTVTTAAAAAPVADASSAFNHSRSRSDGRSGVPTVAALNGAAPPPPPPQPHQTIDPAAMAFINQSAGQYKQKIRERLAETVASQEVQQQQQLQPQPQPQQHIPAQPLAYGSMPVQYHPGHPLPPQSQQHQFPVNYTHGIAATTGAAPPPPASYQSVQYQSQPQPQPQPSTQYHINHHQHFSAGPMPGLGRMMPRPE